MYPWSELPRPLRLNELYVLLALAHGETYGYALHSRIVKDSLGAVKLSDGTLYKLLERMHDDGLIHLAGERPTGRSGRPRMHYGLARQGSIRLKEEMKRLEQAVLVGRAMGYLDEDGMPLDLQKLVLEAGQ